MENHKIYKIILLLVLLSVFTVLFFFRVSSVQAFDGVCTEPYEKTTHYSEYPMDFANAQAYCNNLDENGSTNWALYNPATAMEYLLGENGHRYWSGQESPITNPDHPSYEKVRTGLYNELMGVNVLWSEKDESHYAMCGACTNPIPPIPELPPLSSIYAQIPVMEYPVERHQFTGGLWWHMFRRHWYMWIDYPSNNIKLCIVDDSKTVFQPIGELSRFNKFGQAQTQGHLFYIPHHDGLAKDNNLALIQNCSIDYDGVPVSYFYQDGNWYESNQHFEMGENSFPWFDDSYSGNIGMGVLNPNYDLYDTFASSLPIISLFRGESEQNIYGYNDIFAGTNGHHCTMEELGDTDSWFADCPIAHFDESIYKPLIVLAEDSPIYNPPFTDSIDDWLPFGEYEDWFPNEWPAFDYVRVALNSLGQRVHNLLNFVGKFFVPNPNVLASHMENVRIAFSTQPLVNSFTVTLASILSSFAVGSSTLPSFDFTIFGVTSTLDFASMIPVFDAVRPIVQISLFIGTVFYLYKFLIRLIGEGANLPTGQPNSNTSSNNNN